MFIEFGKEFNLKHQIDNIKKDYYMIRVRSKDRYKDSTC